MQDFIIAMLAISAILIIRDMAKIVFWGRKRMIPCMTAIRRKNGWSSTPGRYRSWQIRFITCLIGRST